jgi:hypothetical protein
MPQYAIIGGHPPGDCPVSNKSARQFAKKALSQMDDLANKLGIKFVVPYTHLDPAHKSLMLLEADKAETVRDFLVQGGFFHFLDCELYLVSRIADLMKDIDNVPTAYE